MYVALIWFPNTSPSLIQKLLTIQNSALRIAIGCVKMTSPEVRLDLRGTGRRRRGRVESSHRAEKDVGGVWEAFDDEVDDE